MFEILEVVSKLLNGQDILDSFPKPHTFIQNEILHFLNTHSNIYLYSENDRNTNRTRQYANFKAEDLIAVFTSYINTLWSCIAERLTHFDHEGLTCWSEAPAEAVFSVLDYIIDHKRSLSDQHMVMLCRVIREGPSPGTIKAKNLTQCALSKWLTNEGQVRFAAASYMYGITSTTVAAALNKE